MIKLQTVVKLWTPSKKSIKEGGCECGKRRSGCGAKGTVGIKSMSGYHNK